MPKTGFTARKKPHLEYVDRPRSRAVEVYDICSLYISIAAL
jgi:hypothetical protein